MKVDPAIDWLKTDNPSAKIPCDQLARTD